MVLYMMAAPAQGLRAFRSVYLSAPTSHVHAHVAWVVCCRAAAGPAGIIALGWVAVIDCVDCVCASGHSRPALHVGLACWLGLFLYLIQCDT
jgi:hypothetical protein